MALVRLPPSDDGYQRVPLGPARIFIDDVEAILELLEAAGNRANEHDHHNVGAAPRLHLGNDVLAEHPEDLRMAGHDELRDIRIVSPALLLAMPLGEVGAWLAVDHTDPEALEFTRDVKQIIARRRTSLIRAVSGRLGALSLAVAVFVNVGSLLWYGWSRSPWVLWGAVVGSALVGTAVVETLRSIRQRGFVAVVPRRLAEHQSLRDAARHQGAMGALWTIAATLVAAVVLKLLSLD